MKTITILLALALSGCGGDCDYTKFEIGRKSNGIGFLKNGTVRIAYQFEFPDGSESKFQYMTFTSTSGVNVPLKYTERIKTVRVELKP